MIQMHEEHTTRGVPPEVETAWLHHRFTQIHPFEDGNGRVARAIASLVFIKARWFPLVIRSADKARYIDALEQADAGNLEPLVSEFTSVQKRVLLAALDLGYRVTPPETIDAAVAAARDLFIGMGKIVPKEWMAAKTTAQYLFERARVRLVHAAERLKEEIGSVRPDFRFQLTHRSTPNWDGQILEVARDLHYSANTAEQNQSAWLTLKTPRETHLVVSFHGLGTMYRGILAVSAFLDTESEDPTPACDEFFQINYQEEPSQAQMRFDPWLERSIAKGLSLWQHRVAGERNTPRD